MCGLLVDGLRPLLLWPESGQECIHVTKVKALLGNQCFKTNEDNINGINCWLGTLVTEFFYKGFQKLVKRSNKHLYVGGKVT